MYLKVDFGRSGEDRLYNTRHIKPGHIEFIQTMTEGGNVLAGSRMLPIISGAVYIIDSSQPHCTAPKDPACYLRHCVTVDSASFDSFVDAVFLKEMLSELYTHGVYFSKPDNEGVKRIEKLFSKLSEQWRSDAPESDKFHTIFSILLLLRDRSVELFDKTEDKSVVGRALGFLDGKVTSGMSTNEVAEALHVSKHYLCHAFKQKTGMTLTEYLLDKRLSIASKLLLDKSLTVAEVAERSGFSSESYFISKFRMRYGITPGKMRGGE